MLGTQEIILMALVIIILFGASKIPQLARSLGKATGEFKRAKHETERELMAGRKVKSRKWGKEAADVELLSVKIKEDKNVKLI